MKILKYFKKYIWLIVLSFACAAITTLCQTMIPLSIGRAIDAIVVGDGFRRQTFTHELSVVAGLTIYAAFFQWLMTLINNRVVYKFSANIRKKASDRIFKMPLSLIDNKSVGDTVSRITVDVETAADGLLLGFGQTFTGVITIILTIVFMFRMNVWISLIVICLTPLSFFVASFISKMTHKFFEKQARDRGEMTNLIEEMIGKGKTVKAYGYEKKAEERFADINKRLVRSGFLATFYSSTVNPGTRFVNNLIYAAVAAGGAYIAVTKGSITVGVLVSFLTYANQYMKPFNEISNVLAEIQNAWACGDRVCQMIESESEVPDKTGAVELDRVIESAADRQKGDVVLENVDFSYNKDKELLTNVNLHAKPGMRVAIVGPTGCGKSTLINLLMRFYDVDKGAVKVQNIDIRDVKRNSLRKSYGMVLQETWLKSGTIRENICYGYRDATDEEIYEAARITHADKFIRQMPLGYDTYISEDGGQLSEGQKQLLCITRVMLKLPHLLILDEATSSIDTRTEQRIQKTFAKMMKGRTSFIVAHRLSTIREADLILVMKDGNIIEQGTHESLMEMGGFYKKLYMSQFEVV